MTATKLQEFMTCLNEGRPFDRKEAVAVVARGLREAASSGDEAAALLVFEVFAKLGEEAAFRTALTAAGVVPSIKAVLLWRHATPMTIQSAFRALTSFAGEPGDAADVAVGPVTAMTDMLVVDALVNALAAHMADPGVAAAGCSALWALGKFLSAAAALRRAGAVSVVVAVLKEHKHRAEIAASACFALSRLLLDPACMRQMYERGCAGIAAVIDAMRCNEGDAHVARAACAVLFLTENNPEPLMLLVRDAAPLLVAAMHRHKDNSELLRDAVATLANRARAAQRTPLMRAGVAAAVVMAMEEHPTDGELMYRACTALCALEEPKEQDDELRLRLRRESSSIGKALIRALRKHATHPMTAMAACRGLTLIVAHAPEGQAAEFLREGALLGLTAALKEFPANSRLVQGACFGLFELTKHDFCHASREESSLMLADAKITQPVAAALRANLALRGDLADHSVSLAVRLLARVANVRDEPLTLGRLGAAADVTAALVRPKTSSTDALAGAYVLKCMALPDNYAALLPVRVRAVEALGEVMRLHIEAERVVTECAGALEQPCFQGATISLAAAKALVQVLSRHKANASIAASVGMALENLCLGDEGSNECSRNAFLKAVRRYLLFNFPLLLLPARVQLGAACLTLGCRCSAFDEGYTCHPRAVLPDPIRAGRHSCHRCRGCTPQGPSSLRHRCLQRNPHPRAG